MSATNRSSQDPAQLITQREAAARLTISERTFRMLVATGQIPVVRVSPRRVVVDPADLARYIRKQRDAS